MDFTPILPYEFLNIVCCSVRTVNTSEWFPFTSVKRSIICVSEETDLNTTKADSVSDHIQESTYICQAATDRWYDNFHATSCHISEVIPFKEALTKQVLNLQLVNWPILHSYNYWFTGELSSCIIPDEVGQSTQKNWVSQNFLTLNTNAESGRFFIELWTNLQTRILVSSWYM